MLLFSTDLGAREYLRDREGGRVKVQNEHAKTEEHDDSFVTRGFNISTATVTTTTITTNNSTNCRESSTRGPGSSVSQDTIIVV